MLSQDVTAVTRPLLTAPQLPTKGYYEVPYHFARAACYQASPSPKGPALLWQLANLQEKNDTVLLNSFDFFNG
jgi:hypothetical protein